MRPFGFDNSYARDLPELAVAWKPAAVPVPRLLYLNEPLADELGLDTASLRGPEGAALFAGNTLPEGAEPVAQAYAGHQFGGYSPVLGDGRALLLGELTDRTGQRRDVAFKGSGRTPFSRGGDGKAAVGPMLREALVSEAMQALGIPTTRALAVAATGETVRREVGLPGAVLTRVAASHLRVGSFQFVNASGDRAVLARLAEHAIARHDPELVGQPGRYLGLLRAVVRRQARLIAQWMSVGFIHGVMNTDNMTISGETIDYGPCAFMEAYDPAAVFSSIDHGGRYAYHNQSGIARWNLERLAIALLPLIATADEEAALKAAVDEILPVLDGFQQVHEAETQRLQRAKLGLGATAGLAPEDMVAETALIRDWFALLQSQQVDHTSAWRLLADAVEPGETALHGLFADRGALDVWLARWRQCGARDSANGGPSSPAARAARMREVNPRIIPRNHRVEEALAAATAGDLAPFERLLAAVQRPYDDDPALAPYAEPAPAEVTAGYQTFCGT